MKTLITSAILASVIITGSAQADDSLSNLIYEESSNIYSEVNIMASTQEGIASYGDDANKNSVWSTEFEQYVNPEDFKQTVASIDDVNHLIDSNPTAAGKASSNVFTYNETAGEYHLQ